MGFWGRRDRAAEEQQQANDAELTQRAQNALVMADERIRATGDELAFASAELGDAATAELRIGLESVREHMTEAFRLNQLNHDHIPDTAEELRTRNARIVQLCDWAEQVLDERTQALKGRVELVRAAPEVLQRVRADVERLRERLPETQETLARLAQQYSSAALQRVRMTTDEVEQLLDFALRSADLSERRRAAGKSEEANLALETATETVRRANSVFDSIDGFEIEALRTQNTLAEVIADSRGDLASARTERRTPAVDEAIVSLEAVLSELGDGVQRDPFADLALVSAANATLDAARERASKPVPSLEHVQHDVSAADHAIGIAASVIDGHRGWIGSDARTRLAEAQRVRAELAALPTDEGTRERAQEFARRAASLADDALRLAQRDIDASRPNDSAWGWGGGSGRARSGGFGGSDLLGPVIGGVILGGLLDDIFD